MKKVVGLVLSLLISSFAYVTPSYAGECSAEDPCHTYAEVNSSGVVVNIIVCQPSVCGPNGQWSGKNPNNGNNLVLQVAANPETHENQGGYFNPPSSGNNVVTESNGTFTINRNEPVINNYVVVTETNEAVMISTVVASNNSQSFTFEDTVGKTINQIEMKIIELPIETDATIKISVENFNTNNTSLQSDASTELTQDNESIESKIIYENTFTERKTVDELKQEIVEKNIESENYDILNNVFTFVIGMLGNWVIYPI